MIASNTKNQPSKSGVHKTCFRLTWQANQEKKPFAIRINRTNLVARTKIKTYVPIIYMHIYFKYLNFVRPLIKFVDKSSLICQSNIFRCNIHTLTWAYGCKWVKLACKFNERTRLKLESVLSSNSNLVLVVDELVTMSFFF